MSKNLQSLSDVVINRSFIQQVNKEQFLHDKQLNIDGELLQKNQAKLKQKEIEAEEEFGQTERQINAVYSEFEEEAQSDDHSEDIKSKGLFIIAFKKNSNKPILLPSNTNVDKYEFVSKLKVNLELDRRGNPIEKIDFSYFIKEYELFRFKNKTRHEFEVINKNWEVKENETSNELLDLKRQYLQLSLEDKIDQTQAIVIQKYIGELETPEIVEYNKYDIKDIQFAGIKHYPALANKYTREIIMVHPNYNPYEDFKNDFQLIKMSSKDKRIYNPLKNLDDIRNRKDAKYFNLSINYRNQDVENNTKMFNFVETKDSTDYQLRHIYFNEKYFLTEDEKDEKLNEYLDVLLSQELSKNTFDYIFRMFIKSLPHKYYLFGQKYFGTKLQSFFNNQWIEYNASIHDKTIISKADKISPISYIMWNDGEESPKIDRFKKRNQLITQQIKGGYLREIIFESKVPIDEIQDKLGEPTVYFEFNGIYHYAYSLKENYITLNMFDKVYETLHNFLNNVLTKEQIDNTVFNQNEMFFNNFQKKYYVNYKLSDNKINLNKLRKM